MGKTEEQAAVDYGVGYCCFNCAQNGWDSPNWACFLYLFSVDVVGSVQCRPLFLGSYKWNKYLIKLYINDDIIYIIFIETI